MGTLDAHAQGSGDAIKPLAPEDAIDQRHLARQLERDQAPGGEHAPELGDVGTDQITVRKVLENDEADYGVELAVCEPREVGTIVDDEMQFAESALRACARSTIPGEMSTPT